MEIVVLTGGQFSLSDAIRTSMNLNQNRRVELIEISDDHALTAALVAFVDRIFGRVSPAVSFTSQSASVLDTIVPEHASAADTDDAKFYKLPW